MSILVKLAAVSPQGAEDVDLHAQFVGSAKHGVGGSAEQGVEGQLLLKKGQSKWGMVKVIYCQSQSGGMWFCFDTHWYVALKPQDLHVFELLLWQENVSESSLAYAALASNAQAFGTAGEQRCVPTSASGHSTFSPYGLANYYSEPAIHQDPIVIYQDHHITFCGTLPNKIRSVSFYGTARRCRCSRIGN